MANEKRLIDANYLRNKLIPNCPIEEGGITVAGKKMKKFGIHSSMKASISMLPSNRKENSVIQDMSILENMFLSEHTLSGSIQHIFRKKEMGEYGSMKGLLNIKAASPADAITSLSGGNQQKVCVSRALTFQPELLLIGEPTRGIDVYSKELILQWIQKMNEEYGTTVIVSSGELEELIRTCDRIAVMHQGHIYKIFDGDISLEELTLALYGRDIHEN